MDRNDTKRGSEGPRYMLSTRGGSVMYILMPDLEAERKREIPFVCIQKGIIGLIRSLDSGWVNVCLTSARRVINTFSHLLDVCSKSIEHLISII